jgi:hypothetical protein
VIFGPLTDFSEAFARQASFFSLDEKKQKSRLSSLELKVQKKAVCNPSRKLR